jgi:hypothetical protein
VGSLIRVLRDRVAELRPAYLPPDPASRTACAVGEIARCDFWFPPLMLPVGFGQARKPTQLPVLTMVCAYSRWLAALLVPSRTAADLFAGWWQLIAGLGAVPRVLVWDGEGAIGRWRAGRPELTAECQAFRGMLGASATRLHSGKPVQVVTKQRTKVLSWSPNGPVTGYLPLGRSARGPATERGLVHRRSRSWWRDGNFRPASSQGSPFCPA